LIGIFGLLVLGDLSRLTVGFVPLGLVFGFGLIVFRLPKIQSIGAVECIGGYGPIA
jgi:hypothetical protein